MTADGQGPVGDTDDRVRCPWAVDGPGSSLYRDYHDYEWGRPLHGRDEMFERLSLEAFQSGLSWLTILRKREAFRAAFHGFDVEAVARFTEADVHFMTGMIGHHAQALIMAAMAPKNGASPAIRTLAARITNAPRIPQKSTRC